MKRRRVNRRDGNGHPLGGLALIFPLALAFALALALALFTGLGLKELLTAETFTLVTNPGGEDMRVVVKRDGEIQTLSLDGALPVQGVGTLVGSFYKLADGSVVWVAQEPGYSIAPTVEPTPDPYTAPTPTPATPEGVTPTPSYSTPSLSPTPTPTNTFTPPTRLLP